MPLIFNAHNGQEVMHVKDRTDLAVESAAGLAGTPEGVALEKENAGGAEITWVRIDTEEAARRIGKPCGNYWTLCHRELPLMDAQARMEIARRVAETLWMLLPKKGSVLVLGLGNRYMTADALGPRTVEGVLVTRQLQDRRLRSVSALSPGVMGVTGIETAELAQSLADKLKPDAIIVIDALAAMETGHICTTIQVTDTGIRPGSGVGNHRQGITRETMNVPVIAIGVPMVVYASTIVRDTLRRLIAHEASADDAEIMADELARSAPEDMVVTPRDIDEQVAGLGDLLALAINTALHPTLGMEALSHELH